MQTKGETVVRAPSTKRSNVVMVCCRVVGNDHFCDTTKRASQRLTPHIQGEIPLCHRSGNKPLAPQPWSAVKLMHESVESTRRDQ